MVINPLPIQLFNSKVISSAISFRGIKYLFHVLISADGWGFINNLIMKNNSKGLKKTTANDLFAPINDPEVLFWMATEMNYKFKMPLMEDVIDEDPIDLNEATL